ncbi:MAG: sugar ABC transporter ATP-binding protein [Rhodobacteraceae bacterium]|nr:sugar ABC transporter ATP-binding protein [Paracoccaceae bacterium]
MTPLAVEMSGIHKSFGGISALKGVDLAVRPGSIHALVGENGAGKSTLLKILQGVISPDGGEIRVHGTALGQHAPEASRAAGLGMIFQELSLVPTLTVAENIFLNRELLRFTGTINRKAERSRARDILASLGMEIDPDSPVGSLATGQRQMVEIAKALSQDARILILDEPTAALSTAEVAHLFGFLRDLKKRGLSAIYVSHRMDEIIEIADDVTILRDGRNVAAAALSDITLEGIVEAMIGKKVTNFAYRTRQIDRNVLPLLEVRGVSAGARPVDCSFRLFPGEVLGIAGLMGAGRSELVRSLFGVDRRSAGEIFLYGKPLQINSPSDAIAAGIVLIPESRQREGLVVDHSVIQNLSLPQIDALTTGGFVATGRERKLAADLIARLRIKTGSPHAAARSLSGGNQQKIVIAKWLATNPEVILLDEPTAGIDIGSKGEIVDLVRSFAETGKAVVVISSEPAELLALADRILIMSNGRIVREMTRDELHRNDGAATSGQLLQSEQVLQVAIQKANTNDRLN